MAKAVSCHRVFQRGGDERDEREERKGCRCGMKATQFGESDGKGFIHAPVQVEASANTHLGALISTERQHIRSVTGRYHRWGTRLLLYNGVPKNHAREN